MSFDYTQIFCIFKLRSNHALAQTCQSHNMYSFSKNENQTKTKNDSSQSPFSPMIILILSEVKSVELDGSLNLTYVWRSVCMQQPVSAQPVMPSYLGSSSACWQLHRWRFTESSFPFTQVIAAGPGVFSSRQGDGWPLGPLTSLADPCRVRLLLLTAGWNFPPYSPPRWVCMHFPSFCEIQRVWLRCREG